MDTKTLISAMSGDYAAPVNAVDYAAWAPIINQGLVWAKCTTVNRAAMWLAQIGAESGSLRWTAELADGAAYNGRRDLGNTQAGDGPRFKGRSLIQITGRHNYGALSTWAHAQGYVPTADYFIQHPDALASRQYATLGPAWYWLVARNMNAYADKKDIYGATVAVNGGTNNLSGRTKRWNHCLALGNRILPSGSPGKKVNGGDDMSVIYAVKKSTVPKGVAWPGYFIYSGHHDYNRLPTSLMIKNLQRAGIPLKAIPYSVHQQIVAAGKL